jgi:hypothetical protein
VTPMDVSRRLNMVRLTFKSKSMTCPPFTPWIPVQITVSGSEFLTLCREQHLSRYSTRLKVYKGKPSPSRRLSSVSRRSPETSPSLPYQTKPVSARLGQKFRSWCMKCQALRSAKGSRSKLISTREDRQKFYLNSGALHHSNSPTPEAPMPGKGTSHRFWRRGMKCRMNIVRRSNLPRKGLMRWLQSKISFVHSPHREGRWKADRD